jgi:release factor glutamine methyltransferase
VEDLARRRAAGEPLQYLTGVAGFRNLELAVGPGVFIPRPETETVVDLAKERLPDGGSVVDLCTGSGAMALALAQERPDARVYATEASSVALGWATRNRDALGLPVVLSEGDLLAALDDELKGSLDVIVSNPPYVADDESSALSIEIVDHEPHVALFSGDDGMNIIRRIAEEAKEWLRPGGWLLMELGEHQRSLVSACLEENGWEDVAIHLDLNERPRIAEARRPR